MGNEGMYYRLQRQFSPQEQPHPLPKPTQLNSSRGNMLLIPPKLSLRPSPSLQFPPSPPPKNSSNGQSPLMFKPSFFKFIHDLLYAHMGICVLPSCFSARKIDI